MSQHDEIYRGVPDHMREHDQRLARQKAEFEQMRQPSPAPVPAYQPVYEPYVAPKPEKPLTEAEKKRAAEQARKREAQLKERCNQDYDRIFIKLAAVFAAGVAIWADVLATTHSAWYAHLVMVTVPTVTSVLALRVRPNITTTFLSITALLVAGLAIWAVILSKTPGSWYAHMVIIVLPTITVPLALRAYPAFTRKARKVAEWTLLGAISIGAIKLLAMILW